jgi:hypothetical protein
VNQIFGPPQPAASTNASSAAESSSTKQGIDQLAALIKARLKPMQYRRGLIDGFLAKTGLDLTIP